MTLSYGVDDDVAAREMVAREVKGPSRRRWAELTTADDRVLQTYRVLGTLIKSVDVSLITHKAELLARGRMPRKEYLSAVAEHEAWRARAINFANCARARRAEIEHRVHRLRRDDATERYKESLLTLAQAVAEHKQAITSEGREPTTADRMLWARLDVLPALAMQSDTSPAARTE